MERRTRAILANTELLQWIRKAKVVMIQADDNEYPYRTNKDVAVSLAVDSESHLDFEFDGSRLTIHTDF